MIQKIIAVKMNYVGDAAMNCVSLYMSRLYSYAVNMKDVTWDERLIYRCKTKMWFTIFDKSAKNFCTNQRHMVTDSIAVAFLFPMSDVQNTRGTTTELCKQTFGGLRRDER